MEMGFFYIKMVGNSMIILSGVMLGNYYSTCIQKRYDALCLWKKNMHIMYGDISYGGVTFLEIIEHLKELNSGIYKEFYIHLERGISEYRMGRLQELWSNAIEQKINESYLEEQDYIQMSHIGYYLGNMDKEQQLSMIQLHLDKMEYLIREIDMDKDKKMKLFRMLGSLGSVFVVILFL